MATNNAEQGASNPVEKFKITVLNQMDVVMTGTIEFTWTDLAERKAKMLTLFNIERAVNSNINIRMHISE